MVKKFHLHEEKEKNATWGLLLLDIGIPGGLSVLFRSSNEMLNLLISFASATILYLPELFLFITLPP